MAGERPNNMNLDLNLGPDAPPSRDEELGSINLEDWLGEPARDAVGLRTRARQRWRTLWRPVPIPVDSRNIALEFMGGSGLETGEGSVAAEERPVEVVKTCDNSNGFLEDGTLGKKEDVEKGDGDEGSFFDCNICLDLASDPVVTCCGHLFCWPCLYRWLHVHSDAKECPICKGEVSVKNVIPIYGRRNNTIRESVEDPSLLKIPVRPQARRIESWRQTIQRHAFTVPMEEMIRRLSNRFDLSADTVQVHSLDSDNDRELPQRSSSLLNLILTSRGMRMEQNTAPPSDVADEDLTPNSPTATMFHDRLLSSVFARRSNGPLDMADADPTEGSPTATAFHDRWFSAFLARRSTRAATIATLTSALSSTERAAERFVRSQTVETNQEQPQAVDDRDSISSIAAIIQSESQTLDTAIEIDSTVSLSTSSSRRRGEPSRVSDVDSGDSRPPRRRRLH